jgi:hypothetical protein
MLRAVLGRRVNVDGPHDDRACVGQVRESRLSVDLDDDDATANLDLVDDASALVGDLRDIDDERVGSGRRGGLRPVEPRRVEQ